MINKDFFEKTEKTEKLSAFNAYNLSLKISLSKGKNTSTIFCPKKSIVKPFLIINN